MENVKLLLIMQYLLAAEMAHEDSLLQGAFPLSSIYKYTVPKWYRRTISTLTIYIQYSRKCVLL